MFATEQRRRFGAVVALVAGAFLLLALLPIDLTGPLGRLLGPMLWGALGIGAIGAPLLGLLLGLAGFERLPRLDMKRAAVLTIGFALLIPYVIGVLFHVTRGQLDPTPDLLSWPARLTGWFPGFFVDLALGSIGLAGALLAGFICLTAVTLGTLAWHPLQRLERNAIVPDAPAWKAGPSMRPAVIAELVDAMAADESVRQGELFTPRLSRRRKVEQMEIEDAIRPPPRNTSTETPPIDLLDAPAHGDDAADEAELRRLGELLLATLRTFKVESTLAGFTSGPTVTQFEVVPAAGVKAGRIIALADDLAITMRATSLRVAPIPGRGAVGVEIPNPKPRMVTLRELLDTDAWHDTAAVLPVALGLDVEGRPIIADLAKMPHLLVAGATGSGKSVAINTIITSLIYKYSQKQLRFVMVDPKMVELSMYNDLPHMRHPVVTDNNDAAKVLKWAVYEMNRRYTLLHANGARQLSEFNRKVVEKKPLRNSPGARPTLTTIAREAPDTPPSDWTDEYTDGELPMIVLIVDELADLMMTVQGEVETPLAMLAQKARAIGIHLILATQRPSVNVLTGLIKANFPSRVAFRVASKVDSRTILDQNGAEALLGNGDMLFLPPGRNEPQRLQGAYISTEETERVMHWYTEKHPRELAPEESNILDVISVEAATAEGNASSEDRDTLFRQAAELCVQNQGGSTSLLQRRLGVGYGRAARIIDQLHDAGILGPPNGSKPRDVLISLHQVEEYL